MDARVRLGIVLGLLSVLAIGTPRGVSTVRPGPLLPDCEGRIEEVVIHYHPSAAPLVTRAYRDFLGVLPADVTVRLVCPDEEAFADLSARMGPLACRLEAVAVHRPMTPWSRDRWLALCPGQPGGPVTLLSPGAESGEEVWPARAGDRRTGDDLAAALAGRVVSRRAGIAFDGGDFAADDETVFVTPEVARRNPGHRAADLAGRIESALGRRVVLLADAPDYHAGMFLMPVGDRTVLVGDPSLAARVVDGDLGIPCGADFTQETQARFDAVARTCRAAGYRVVRFPVVPGCDMRTWLTGLNAILDVRDGRRIVHMPVYRHVPALNAAAARIWESVGYDVVPVDCTETYRHAGSLRCLVNVMRRNSPPSRSLQVPACSWDMRAKVRQRCRGRVPPGKRHPDPRSK